MLLGCILPSRVGSLVFDGKASLTHGWLPIREIFHIGFLFRNEKYWFQYCANGVLRPISTLVAFAVHYDPYRFTTDHYPLPIMFTTVQ